MRLTNEEFGNELLFLVAKLITRKLLKEQLITQEERE